MKQILHLQMLCLLKVGISFVSSILNVADNRFRSLVRIALR